MFGAVSLTKKTVDVDIYKYSGHGTGLDRRGTFSVGKGFGRNCITFVLVLLWVLLYMLIIRKKFLTKVLYKD